MTVCTVSSYMRRIKHVVLRYLFSSATVLIFAFEGKAAVTCARKMTRCSGLITTDSKAKQC